MILRKQFKVDPKLDIVFDRFIDAPKRLVWEALTKPEHLKEWYMPREFGRVSRAEMDLRPGGMFSIDIAAGDGGQEFPNLGCFLEVVPQERLSWTSMLFPGYRPAVFDDPAVQSAAVEQGVGLARLRGCGTTPGDHSNKGGRQGQGTQATVHDVREGGWVGISTRLRRSSSPWRQTDALRQRRPRHRAGAGRDGWLRRVRGSAGRRIPSSTW